MGNALVIDDDTLSAIRRAFAEELDRRSRIDAEQHAKHHQFIDDLLRCRARRREIAMRVTQQVLGAGAVVGLAWLGSVVLRAAARAFQSLGSGQ